MRVRKIRDKSGFTLVELIVVIAIIGVLSTLIVPSFISYVRQARERAAMAECKILVNSASASVTMELAVGDYPILINKPYNGDVVGRVTNWMLGRVQRGEVIPSTDENYVDYLIAKSMLNAIDSENTDFDFYGFSGNDRNMINMTAEEFIKKYNCTGVLLAYDENSKIILLEYVRGKYFVRYKDGEYKVMRITDSDAKFSNVQDP